MYRIYVQFDSSYNGYAGYVGEWKPGYYPSIYNFLDSAYVQTFPSRNAAMAYARRMKGHFGSRLKYWEVI